MNSSPESTRIDSADTKKLAAELLEVIDTVMRELRPNDSTLPTPSLDMTFDRDIGLDSLARVELAARVEKTFALALSEQAMAEAQTPRDVLRVMLKSANNSSTTLSIETIDVKLAPLNEGRLRRVLSSYLCYYHSRRTHRSLDEDAPAGRPVRSAEPGKVLELPIVHGLHHCYVPRAA